jgi:hypothetical protein
VTCRDVDSKQASSRTSAPPPCHRLTLSITAQCESLTTPARARCQFGPERRVIPFSRRVLLLYKMGLLGAAIQRARSLPVRQILGLAVGLLLPRWPLPRGSLCASGQNAVTTPISPVSTPARRESRIGPRRNALLHLFWFSYFPPSLIVVFFPSALFPSSSLVLIANFGVRQFGISLLLRTLYICRQHESIRQ